MWRSHRVAKTRQHIRSTVESTPGIHFSELVRQSGFAPGQVQYHIRQLRKAEQIVEEACYGQTHYYPTGFDKHERRVIALLRRETTSAIVHMLLEDDAALHPTEIASSLSLARSTVEYHLDRLEAETVIEKREGLNGMTIHVVDPDNMARLQEVTHPTLSKRLVDRFERLVDDLGER